MEPNSVDPTLVEVERALVMPFVLDTPFVCVTCRAVIHEPDGSSDMCENCVENARALDGEVTPVLPVTLYTRESVMRTWLTHYKPDIDGEHGEVTSAADVCVTAITLVLSNFFDANDWLLKDVDDVLVVPSTRRPPPHPLEEVVSRTAAGRFLVTGQLTRTRNHLEHRSASSIAYEGSEALRGRRVLLVDDVYASGARLQSAAAATRRAGGTVARAVVIARRVNPGYHPVIEERWNAAVELPFTWSRQEEGSTISRSSFAAPAAIEGS